MSGFFITFEGGEGVGKTTQVSLVAEQLKLKGYDVLTTREPGGTLLGEKIREVLLKGDVDKMEPITEALLFTAVRFDHVNKVIKPALEAGKIVISDRYVDTTFAYQGFAHNLGIPKMQELYKFVLGDFYPDLTVIFDIEFGKSHGNLTEINRFENMGSEWLLRGVQGFRKVQQLYPNRCVLMDSTGLIPDVTMRILNLINQKLGL